MTLHIDTRADWGARPASHELAALRYPVAEVWLHHEGGAFSPATLSVEQERAKMRELQRDVMNRGYTDFPYGVSVFGSGRAYEGRDLGFVGDGVTVEEAATMGHNATSVAILWPGNFQTQLPTPDQLQTTAEVIQLAQATGVVKHDATIGGHSDVYPTACPGSNAYGALPDLRARVAHAGPPVDWNAIVVVLEWVDRFTHKALRVTPARKGLDRLSYGMRGPDVRILNDLLVVKGFLHGSGDAYSLATWAAVRAAKDANHWPKGPGRSGRHVAARAAAAIVQ